MKSSDRILKLKSLKKAREHFHLDFINDIGIINLLRKEYLKHGDFKRIFEIYQNSRLDTQSYRYESLFALLIITIAGAVISGVILDIYQNNKEKLKKIITEGLIDLIHSKRKTNKLIKKFCSVESHELLSDLTFLKNCYIARMMLDEQIISLDEYHKLIDYLLVNASFDFPDELISKFTNHKKKYNQLKNSINEDKIMLTIRSYARGTLIQYLEKNDVEMPQKENLKTANFFKGIPAAPGVAKGKSYLFGAKKIDNPTNPNYVLCVDSNKFSPEYIDILCDSVGVVTCNCGITGHIPTNCRSIGIGCVIIKSDEFKLLKNDDEIIISGKDGIVATGLIVST